MPHELVRIARLPLLQRHASRYHCVAQHAQWWHGSCPLVSVADGTASEGTVDRKSIPTTYTEARETLAGRDSRTIANNTRLVDIGGHGIGLRLHSTCVVTFRPDGSLVLNTGGWQTVTTKDRINRVIRAQGWSLFAKARTWYIARRGHGAVAFEDGFTIRADQAREPEQDARVENHGTICLVRPLSDCALAWLTAHTNESWFGSALTVEHRYVADLVAGPRDAGFIVEAA